jgi:hypothetical protein
MKTKTQNTNTLAGKILDLVYVGGFLSLFTFTVMQIINS